MNPSPLVELLKKVPAAKVQLINSAGPLLGQQRARRWSARRKSPSILPPPKETAASGDSSTARIRVTEVRSPWSGCCLARTPRSFPCESALMKLFESPLSLEQLEMLMHANARRLIG